MPEDKRKKPKEYMRMAVEVMKKSIPERKKEAITELNSAEISGYDFVKSKNEVSKKEYAEHFGLSDKVAQNQLRKMRNLALIGDNGESHKSNNYKYVYKE